MDKDFLIRSEAKDFFESSFPYHWSYSNQVYEFIQEVNDKLYSYKFPEYKSIFLDEIRTLIIDRISEYNENETNSDHYGYLTTQKSLFFIEQEIDLLPQIIHPNPNKIVKYERNSVFVSYSHEDSVWLEKLKRHFKPLIRENKIDFWDDSRIEPSQKWKEEIKKAIQKSKVAILLVSADFFASDFIHSDELPPLLEAAESDGAKILSIIVKPCNFSISVLSNYQAINNPSHPVLKMSELEQEELWSNLVGQVSKLLSTND